MIYHNGSRVEELFLKGTIPIIAVYYKQLNRKIEQVWPDEDSSSIIDIILSCYHKGYWDDEYPWTDDTPWTD